ncbi:hypothetical protein LCGC14_0264710 [marine sediment metagenome]|uniref:Uncharacterized protein n=1 Tax=marine sediment metagenome TaxID=412755 RepID=A0A0F9X5S0_9ZZZZ
MTTVDLIQRLAEGETLKCAMRGCTVLGMYYLRRVNARGRVVAGTYCDYHDRQAGTLNMRRWAREIDGHLTVLADEQGEYEAVLILG